MRLILLIISFFSFFSLCFGQGTKLYKNLNDHYFLLNPTEFLKVTEELKVLARYDNNGFDIFNFADVSNPHYLCLFSNSSQKVWILDNELALLDEIRLEDKFDDKISKLFLLNKSLYLYSEVGSSWYVYDIFTNKITFQEELPVLVDKVIAFHGCGGAVYFQSSHALWKVDLFSSWEEVNWVNSTDSFTECGNNNCNYVSGNSESFVLVNPLCGKYFSLYNSSMELGESPFLLGDVLYYLKNKKIHSLKVN